MRSPVIVVLLALMPVLAAAQDTLTPAERQAVDAYLAARKAWMEPGITTCLDDANTDVAFLDDFRPLGFYPLAEMPRIRGYGYVLPVAGCYEMDAPTFCLEPGTYGPGGGDGYALARLRGKTAPLVHQALWGWTEHPEIPQEHVQWLLWALVRRTSLSDLPPEQQAVARALLGTEGVVLADAAAPGPEPLLPGLDDPMLSALPDTTGASIEETFAAYQARMEQAQRQLEALGERMERGEQVPMEEFQAATERLEAIQTAMSERLGLTLQQVAQAQTRLDRVMVMAEATFQAIEAEAVLEGDPEPPGGSRSIPETRWSYHPGGFFVRYLPEDYSRSRIEVSVPPTVTLERDAAGRILAIADEHDNRLQVVYADGSPVMVGGETGLTASVVRELRLTPGGAKTLTVAGGWAFNGVPQGGGTPGGPQFSGAAARYLQAQEHVREVSRLVAAVAAPDGRPSADAPVPADIADLVDLAHLTEALRPHVPESDEAAPETLALSFLQQAWQDAFCRRVADLAVSAARRRADGTQLAALGVPRALLGRTGGSGGLAALDPGRDGMNPGNRGRQRLGAAPRPHPKSEGKRALEAAMKSYELMNGILDVFSGLTNPVTWLMEKVGLGPKGIPKRMLNAMIQGLFDAATVISQALGGDPPRDDFREFTLPPPPELPRLEPGDGLSTARAQAANQAATGLCDLYVSLRAAQIALDRLGGALQAGDTEWARRQALAFVYYKRQAGEGMLAAAEHYEALLDVMQEEGASAEGISLAQLQAHQQKLRAEGLRSESVLALRQLGMNDGEIEAYRQRRLAFSPEDDLDDPLTLAGNAAGALRDLGEHWLRLPDVPPPTP